MYKICAYSHLTFGEQITCKAKYNSKIFHLLLEDLVIFYFSIKYFLRVENVTSSSCLIDKGDHAS